MKSIRKINGFTFIELILYIALISIFIGGAIQFAWNVIYSRIKSTTQQHVSQNIRFATKRLLFEIRNASGISSVTPSALTLTNSDTARSPTTFALTSGRLMIGQGSSGSCPTTSPCTLTTNDVTVTNLTFTNLSSGSASLNVNVSLTITASGSHAEYQETQSATGSGEIRSN